MAGFRYVLVVALAALWAGSEYGHDIDQFTADMGWNLLGVGLYYALIALISASITVIARTFIVTLVVLVPLVLGVTISLVGVIPFVKYLPDLAGIQLLMPYPGVDLLAPVADGIVMAAWALTFVGAAWVLFGRRDAHSG